MCLFFIIDLVLTKQNLVTVTQMISAKDFNVKIRIMKETNIITILIEGCQVQQIDIIQG